MLLLLFQLTGLQCVLCQGGGDAGSGYAGAMDPFSYGELETTYLSVRPSFGLGQEGTVIYSATVRAEINLWQGISLNASIPYHMVMGDVEHTNGPGDAIFGATVALFENEKIKINFNASGKFPASEPTLTRDERQLPMAYQVTRGTRDLILSTALYASGWHFGIAYQWSGGPNTNQFDRAEWDDLPTAQLFPTSVSLNPGDDIALRVQKNFSRPRARYVLAVLPVQRIQEDSIIEGEDRVSVQGSDGLSLNLQAGSFLKIGKRVRLDLLASVPVVSREVYTDGSKRDLVFIMGFTFLLDEIMPNP